MALEVTTIRALVERVKARHPELTGRVERAAMILVLRDVRPVADMPGYWQVESDSQPGTAYEVSEFEGVCTCSDWHRAPEGRCKHRLAIGLLVMAESRQRKDRERSEVAAARVALALAGCY